MKKDKKELMQNALGLLRDDLISDAQTMRSAAAPKRISWKIPLAACLALLLIAGVCIGTIMHINADPPAEPPYHGQLYSVPNVWARDDFTSIAVLFQNDMYDPSVFRKTQGSFLMLSSREQAIESDDISAEPFIETENLSVALDISVGFENIIADRYAVAYDEHYYPVFYDLEQNTAVDLDTQIIGSERVSLESLIKACLVTAEELYPGILGTQNNRDLLTEFVYGVTRDMVEWRLKYDTFEPDLEFFRQLEGFRYDTEENLRERFFFECLWEIYARAYQTVEDIYQHKPYWVEIMGMDGKNGACLAVIHDVIGNGLSYVLYDFKTDSCIKLPRDYQNSLIGTMWTNGDAEFRFSADGKVISVVYPDAGYSGGDIDKSYLDRYKFEADRDLTWYNGERVGAFYLEHGTAVALPIRASSEAFLSDSGNVVYYKQCNRVRTEQIQTDEWGTVLGPGSVKCPDELWYSRLYSPNKDTDQWVFAVIDPKEGTAVAQTVLQGNFVRFMIDETVALMEKDGVYTAYELASGKDVTAEVSSDTYGQNGYPYHERLVVYEEDGVLYHKDVFGVFDTFALAQVDQYVLSKDGAFAFVYSSQTNKALCINVASGESAEIKITQEFLQQLTKIQGTRLVMSYNEYENTLLFSLCTQPKDESKRAELAQKFADTMLNP